MFLLKLVENINYYEKFGYKSFKPGDIISINYTIALNKDKTQIFTGMIISIKNKGLNSSILIKKKSKGINIEIKFKIFSPFIKSIKLLIKNNFKKSKLYFL